MSLTVEEIKRVANLAKLTSRTQDLKELSGILELVKQMNAVDTRHIAPMAHPLDVAQPLREDEVTEKNQREKLQKIAPAVKVGLYLVPKVIE